ncbi:MAG: thrombospondin type 3 repeat-containing protein [Fibrobacter sp.]|nr:thrombospondin type 3 repeat-containing protein [Fibrobacter sp.]
MKRVFALSILAGSLAFAQSGAQGGSDGFHQQNAYTLGQWGFSVGTGGDMANDSWAFSRGGSFSDENGKSHSFENWAGSFSGNFNLSVGLLSFLDVGVVLPLYYEHAHEKNDIAANNGMWESGLGDLDAWMKIRIPFGDERTVFALATLFDAYAPTGSTSKGVRPRHVWYLNERGYTDPYNAGDWALGAGLAMTLDFSKIGAPIRLNGSGSYVHALGEGQSDAVIYTAGLNFLVNEGLDMYVEYSGEMRVEKSDYPRDPLVDPMLITPGLRFHLPFGIDMGVGLDFAVRNFKNFTYEADKEMKNVDQYKINFKGDDGKAYSYGYASTPLYAVNAMLSWHVDGKPIVHDEDGDGVSDENDQCAHTPIKATIDSVGCPIDSDKDGAIDGYDNCPNTPAGATIDSVGCPMDGDEDGVFDGIDKCPRTKKGAVIDVTGCEGDFDKDGVEDSNDRCPNTQPGIIVDDTGCPADTDRDGVFDSFDKCANTPAGLPVDSTGCAADADKDGIPDALDKCPNTKLGLPVDSTGCPADADKDGVADALDKCPNTRPGAQVNAEGCEGDFDGDGIPDAMDQCPNTKAGLPVDSTGCPADADKDGVADALDKCPNTPIGSTVDNNGCTLDFDKDGVADDLDKCPNTKEGVVVDSTGCPLDSDKDGVFDGVDKCPNTEKNVSVDSTGCPMDMDHDGIADHLDKCPYTLAGIETDSKGCPKNKKEDLNKLKQGIQFQTNSTKFTKNSYGTLNDIVALLNKIPTANLEVQGHTDNVGSAKKNKELSENRALAVTNYLISKGIAASRLRAVGFGGEKPIASNGNKKGRKANRRVELVPFEN